MKRQLVVALLLFMLLWCPPSGGYSWAQTVEPIRCWRQASTGAVTIGETFTVTLTCAVVDVAESRVVPDESRLNVASIQMAPFEIVGGGHPPDLRRGARRFFQYDYQLRIISPDAIGRDVNVPGLAISYRVHSTVGGAASLEGRDLSYLLPPLPIKVLSLVPRDATDIRDAAAASFATAGALGSRASLFKGLALALGVLAAGLLVFALAPLARPAATAGARAADRLPDRAVFHAAAAALDDVRGRVARDGWTDDTLAAALQVMRVLAAALIGHPRGERPLPADGTVPEGRLLVTDGWIRPRKVTLSSGVTADEATRAVAAGTHTAARAQRITGVAAGLAALTTALYVRTPARDAATLDEAVAHAISAAREAARERRWARR